MSLMHKLSIPLVLVAVAFLPLGCSGNRGAADPESRRRNNDLVLIYEIYSQYAKGNQRPPKQLADLNQKQYQGMYPEAVKALQSGEYIVVWGVILDKNSRAVVAYEKDALKQGGFVLLANGTVEKMAADQLNTALSSKA